MHACIETHPLSFSPHFDHHDIRCSTISLVQHVRTSVRTTMVSGPYHFWGAKGLCRKNDVQPWIPLVAKRARVFSTHYNITGFVSLSATFLEVWLNRWHGWCPSLCVDDGRARGGNDE